MPLWVGATLIAALAQTIRFLLQRHLRIQALSTTGATFARFAFSAPMVVAGLGISTLFPGIELIEPPALFWPYVVIGGVAQILGTACILKLFGRRSFAVGMAFSKTEGLLTALMGIVLLGEPIGLPAGMAIVVGFVAVLILSGRPGGWDAGAAALGLAAGALFALAAVCYRGASLSLGDAPALLRAAETLAATTLWQSGILSLFLALRQPEQFVALLVHWRLAALVGLFSMIGSLGWFTAFALKNAAYVKALGQIELVFASLASVLLLGERMVPREILGIGLLLVSVCLILLAG
ncbi:DMT family transporter [Palleronia caenipelagi]|uniref:DMT family transporter n=1 Tax=Palleronia caenipelagi TaxID=2489174 RepID=A0A547QAB8_9RHOB|nr:DMT family transporter [Palleronia caenipelagi]TRD23333.1 DMT family transporter [Palleronia caenipelagi]